MMSYVNKNQYGYDVLGIIIDNDIKVVNCYSPCMMPTGKHKKISKKRIREMIEMYKECGYTIVNK